MGADCNEKCREFDEKGILANETSILFAALSGPGDDQVVKLLLHSGSLCDKASIDVLAEKKNQNLGLFQQLRERNVETRYITHFRELAIRANVE